MPTYPLFIEKETHEKLKEKLFKEGMTIKWLLDKSVEDYIRSG